VEVAIMTSTLGQPTLSRAFRPQRRHSVALTGGIAGVYQVANALLDSGCRVCDFATDMHDGVGVTGVTYTIAATVDEAEHVAGCLRKLPEVVSVDAA
jgi:predicted deacylase